MDVELLKRKKYEKGYSLAQIAKLSGVPLGTVQKIFAGETKHPRYKTLQALESVLGPLLAETSYGNRDKNTIPAQSEQRAYKNTIPAQSERRAYENAVSVQSEHRAYENDAILAKPEQPEYGSAGSSQLGQNVLNKQAEGRYRYKVSSGAGQPGMLKDAQPAYSVSKYAGYTNRPEGEITRAGLPAGKKQGEYTLADYYALPEEHRAELIDGWICDMAAPNLLHQMLGGEIYYQLMSFVKEKNGPCIPFISPVDVQLDADDKTMVQPDAGVLCDRDKLYKGRIIGAPDFVAEILSEATRKRDMTWKLHKYAQAGVREYWIVDPRRKVIVTYFFEGEDYPVIYRMGEKIPARIYGKELEIETEGMLPWTENEELG